MNAPGLDGKSERARRSPRGRRLLAWATGVFLALGVALSVGAYRVVVCGRDALGAVRGAEADARAHRYRALVTALPTVATALGRFDRALSPFRFLEPIPVVGPEVAAVRRGDQAALDILRTAELLRPALLPLLRSHSHLGMGTLTAALSKPLKPAAQDLQAAATLAAIRPPRGLGAVDPLYAERARILQAASMLRLLAGVERPLRAALGLSRPAYYLVMFQDGGELRATGGFYSAWAVLTVRRGRPAPVQVHSISQASSESRYAVPAPFPIRWAFHFHTTSMMNSNFSPNAPTSLARLERYAATVRGVPRLQGVILVDTWMLERLLAVLGPVTVRDVTGEDLTVSDAHTEYTLVYAAERLPAPPHTRKDFLTSLADTLLARARALRRAPARSADAAAWRAVMTALVAGLRQEHVVLYANSPRLENLLERLGWAGAMPAPPHENFLEVVDANYGGRKDNAYMTESVAVRVGPDISRRTQETVSVRLTLFAAADGWLTGSYNGFVSAYFPPGTRVLSVTGDPMAPVTDARATRHPRTMSVGASIHFPAAVGGTPGRGLVVFRVLLPQGLSPFPLIIGKQPGLPVESLSVTGDNLSVRVEQTLSLRVAKDPGGLRLTPLHTLLGPL